MTARLANANANANVNANAAGLAKSTIAENLDLGPMGETTNFDSTFAGGMGLIGMLLRSRSPLSPRGMQGQDVAMSTWFGRAF